MFDIHLDDKLTAGLWDLPSDQLGLVVLLHRAVLIHGAEESGVLPAVIVDDIVEKQSTECAVEGLVDAGLLVFECDPPGHLAARCRVLTWAPLQGSAQHRRRAATRKRVRAHRKHEERKRVTAQKQGEPLGKSPSEGTRGVTRYRDSPPPNSPILQEKSARSGSSSPVARGSSSSSFSSSSEKKRVKRTEPYSTRGPDSVNDIDMKTAQQSAERGPAEGTDAPVRKQERPQEDFSAGLVSAHPAPVNALERSNEEPSARVGLLPPMTPEDSIVDKVTQEWGQLEPMRTVPGVLRDFVVVLHRGYPKVDLIEQGRMISAWWDANPGKRKTRRGLKRFLNSWISRRAREVGAPPPTPSQPTRQDENKARVVSTLWGSTPQKGGGHGRA